MVKRVHRTIPPAYEPFETSLLLARIKPGDTVIDVGANAGQYTGKFLAAVGPDGEVFAFEPDPNNFERLQRNTSAVPAKNLFLEQQAVSNKIGMAYLYLNTRNGGDHRLYDSLDGRKKITVQTVTLSSYFSHYKRHVSLVKMDIQGAEMWALQGMAKLIIRNPGLIIASEFWPFGLRTAGVDPAAYLFALIQSGFKLEEISERTRQLLPITDPVYFANGYPAGSQAYTNILATAI
jgi:FkbM family methyltransferase